MIHDEELVVEGNDLVEVATENVGLRMNLVAVFIELKTTSLLRPKGKLEAKAKFNCGFAIGHDVGLVRVGGEMVEIVDDELNQCVAILVLSGLGFFVHLPVVGAGQKILNYDMNRCVTICAISNEHIVVLERLVIFNPEAQMNRIVLGSPAVDHRVFVELRASLEIPDGS